MHLDNIIKSVILHSLHQALIPVLLSALKPSIRPSNPYPDIGEFDNTAPLTFESSISCLWLAVQSCVRALLVDIALRLVQFA